MLIKGPSFYSFQTDPVQANEHRFASRISEILMWWACQNMCPQEGMGQAQRALDESNYLASKWLYVMCNDLNHV